MTTEGTPGPSKAPWIAAAVGGAVLALSAAFFLGRLTATRAKGQSFSGIELPRLDRSATTDLGACPKAKCMTVYLAPWCGYCRRATPMLKEARAALAEQGIATRFVIGMDKREPVEDYAREFGGEALLDLDAKVKVPGGVPHFFMSDAGGNIFKTQAGAPPSLAEAVRWALSAD